MRVIVVPKNYGGVEYHRLITPYKHMANTMMTHDIRTIDRETIKQHNITTVVFNRNIDRETNNPAPIFEVLKKNGVRIIIDIDDHWVIPYGHVLYNYAKSNNLARCYADQILNADFVTVTHNQLASTINRELGVSFKKIIVAPNAIDATEEQYQGIFKTDYKKLFWQGSVTHHHDLKMIAKDVNATGARIEIAGYDVRSKEQWDNTVNMFSNAKRINAVPVTEYMNFYRGSGISLIPLEKSHFNVHKSNIKLLESGWAKKPCIVSHVHPYLGLAKDGYNCLTAYKSGTWERAIKKLLTDKEYSKDLAAQLHEDVKAEYLMPKVNRIRIDLLNDAGNGI